jgi:hypothetical protein
MSFDYGQKRPDGQHERHPGLPDAATAEKIRPVRESYKHTNCGIVTRMPRHCAETYAVTPSFYGSTFCCGCHDYFPVAQFVWLDDGTVVGS